MNPAFAGFFFLNAIVMEKDKTPQNESRQDKGEKAVHERIKNPFENHQSVEHDIQQSEEELEKEQQFKEAMTERD